jgi:hypothetical protein
MSQFVDVRATRFAGALTMVGGAVAAVFALWWLAAALALVLLLSAWGGPRLNLWGFLYRRLVAPRLSRPTPAQLEPQRPPRFANLLGGLFLSGAAVAGLLGAVWLTVVLAGIVSFLALLNAAFGYCLGCRMYGVLVRDGPLVRILGLSR